MWRGFAILVLFTAAVYGGRLEWDEGLTPNEIEINEEAGEIQLRSSDCCDPINPEDCKNKCGVGFNRKYKEGCGYISCDCVETHDGIFEGDMKVSEKNRQTVNHLYGIYEGDGEQQVRGLTRQRSMFWPKTGNSVNIPYVIGTSDNQTIKAIRAAAEEYKRRTCINLRPRNGETDYIYFKRDGGCWSYIGKNGGQQPISIGSGCAHLGIVLHEIMHALGFFHEQSRPDRDSYVRINTQNIRPGMEGNFEKAKNIDSMGSPYDYSSVMHYGRRAFSRNGQDTITPLRANVRIGQRDGFSDEDIKQINKAYCEGVTATTQRPTTTPRTTTTTTRRTTRYTTQRPTTTPPVNPGDCKNKRSDRHCDFWRSRGYCTHSYVAFMRDFCKKSCGLCTKATCIDKIAESSCRDFRKREYCVNKYATIMERYCPKTCGKCPGSSEIITTTTTQKPETEKSYVVADEQCGVVRVMEYSKQRIIGGKIAEPGTIPWQVSIRSGRAKIAICGGTLIGKEWVLTAAHCFDKFDDGVDGFTVYLGAQHKYPIEGNDSNFVTRGVKQVITHEYYDRYSVANDIALVQLSEPVAYTNYISSVCLPEKHDLPEGTKVVASGFGTTEFYSENLELQKVELFLLNNKECGAKLKALSKKKINYVTNDMVCAWVRGGGKDACQGDSGGPLTFRQYTWQQTILVGVVSWGYGCANKGSPGVYTKVANYRQWIHARTGI